MNVPHLAVPVISQTVELIQMGCCTMAICSCMNNLQHGNSSNTSIVFNKSNIRNRRYLFVATSVYLRGHKSNPGTNLMNKSSIWNISLWLSPISISYL